jgi:hypothetical protein
MHSTVHTVKHWPANTKAKGSVTVLAPATAAGDHRVHSLLIITDDDHLCSKHVLSIANVPLVLAQALQCLHA